MIVRGQTGIIGIGGTVQSGGAAAGGAMFLRVPDRYGVYPPGDVSHTFSDATNAE